VKTPISNERCGDGACSVGGGGLWLRFSVSTSESDVLFLVDVDMRLPRGCSRDARVLRRMGDGFRDAAGVPNGSAGVR
jgi:hypothetical protein